MGALNWLIDPIGLTPHGFCLTWDPVLLWLQVGSDAITMLAYYSIPITLLWFTRKRPEMSRQQRRMLWLFGAFILACGTTHAVSILTIWVPAYWMEGLVKAATALLSIATAVMLWPLVPRLLASPSVETMNRLNGELRAIIADQDATTKELNESKTRLGLAQAGMQRTNEQLERAVTERTRELTQANEALSESEERFRRVVEAAPNAMVMIGTSGLIEMVNAQTEQYFGYARAEMLGRPVEMLLPVRFRQHHPNLRSGFFANPQSRPMGAGHDLFGMRRDGTEFQISIGLSPIETEDGMKVLSAIVDISVRVHLEARLRQSQKLEAVGRLTAGVAHDFNNVLQALLGGLELMLDEVADRPVAVEYGELAYRAAQHGAQLTHRLLAFSRQQILSPRSVSLQQLLSDVEGLIGRTFAPNIALKLAPVAAGCAVIADAAQLEAAVINLAVNARDAMAASGGRLTISALDAIAPAAFELAPRPYTVVIVEDTGPGMDATVLAQAFEPFFSTKGPDGSGLGLSMVQGFARQSGGEVHIESAPGLGTRVEIWLPSAAFPEVEPQAPIETSIQSGRILVVDDAPDVLVTVGAFLVKAGFHVTTVSSGDQALATLVSGTRFDAIVTDYAMPGLNGLDLLIQARELIPDLRGLIITGFSSPDLQQAIPDLIVLRKPFSRTDLVDAMRVLVPSVKTILQG